MIVTSDTYMLYYNCSDTFARSAKELDETGPKNDKNVWP